MSYNIVMTGEKGLSQSLRRRADSFLRSMGYEDDPLLVAGVEIDYPYSEVAHASYNDYIPDGVWKNYETMRNMFDPNNIPPKWVNFIKETAKVRKENGSRGPINLVHGLYFMTEESTCAQKNKLPKFQRLEDGEIDFTDVEMISGLINKVLDNPDLRKEYKQILGHLIPDVSRGYLDKEIIRKVLDRVGIKGGVMLDMGCGTGRDTKEWSEKLGLFTIGLERQYHCQWYDPYWKDTPKDNKYLGFVLGDFSRGVPFKEGSADVAIFQYVAQHVTQKSMEKGLQESLRVLKDGSWLFVGPQDTKDYSEWRFFRKETSEKSKDAHFKEYGYYDLIPEEKPKRKIWRK